jgi:hypothetical protein
VRDERLFCETVQPAPVLEMDELPSRGLGAGRVFRLEVPGLRGVAVNNFQFSKKMVRISWIDSCALYGWRDKETVQG